MLGRSSRLSSAMSGGTEGRSASHGWRFVFKQGADLTIEKSWSETQGKLVGKGRYNKVVKAMRHNRIGETDVREFVTKRLPFYTTAL